jgi:chemotaxis protein MotB
MKPTGGKGLVLIGLLCAVPLSSGCASQKQLKDYQDEVRVLRQERGQLKKENRSLQMQLESYEVALADASARISEVPEQPTTAYPELDDLGIAYGTRGGNLVISIPAEITFGSGKSSLSSKGKQALEAVAQTLMSDHASAQFWIEGHTDDDPISKSKWASNRDLSVARAMKVLHYLVEECGVPDDSCVVAGHGQYTPLVPNDSKGNKAKNRRVEIVVHAAEG